jgi:methanogenic corrinoid protein MtbC1
MLAVSLRADGWQVAYLGADAPLADVLQFADSVSARLVCLSIALAERLEELAGALDEATVPAGTTLVVGGCGVTKARVSKLGAVYVAGDVRDAVAELRVFAG